MLHARTPVIAMLILISACAKPVVAPPVTMADTQKDCAALERDIEETTQLKRAAREEDRFQWKYIFVVNAATSWHRMNKAEQAAVDRLEKLNTIAASKGCLGQQEKVVEPGTPVTPAPVDAVQPQAGQAGQAGAAEALQPQTGF